MAARGTATNSCMNVKAAEMLPILGSRNNGLDK